MLSELASGTDKMLHNTENLHLGKNFTESFYLLDSENKVIFGNEPAEKIVNINGNIKVNNQRSSFFIDENNKDRFHLFYRLNNGYSLMVEAENFKINVLEIYGNKIIYILLFNLGAFLLIYMILKYKMERPVDKIDQGLLDISNKDLEDKENITGEFQDTYLQKNYTKMFRSYTDFIKDLKQGIEEAETIISNVEELNNSIKSSDSDKRMRFSLIISSIEKNRANFVRVYDIIMENHKVNMSILDEFKEIERNIANLKESFSAEKQRTDALEKAINEIDKTAFQINIFGLNTAIESSDNTRNMDFEDGSREIRFHANKVKVQAEEIRSIIKKEKLGYQLKEKSLNLIADYESSSADRLRNMKKQYEKEIIKYMENKNDLNSFIEEFEELAGSLSKNRGFFDKEAYFIKRLEEKNKKLKLLVNEYRTGDSSNNKVEEE